MKILERDSLVDFEVPFYMSERQTKRFIEGMKTIFGNRMSVENIIENKKEIGEFARHPKKFSEEDYIDLANPGLDNSDVAAKLGKSEFAVQMKRGPFYMELQQWARKKGKNKLTDKDVREFLEDAQ